MVTTAALEAKLFVQVAAVGLVNLAYFICRKVSVPTKKAARLREQAGYEWQNEHCYSW
jgi:hypothetical protein